MMTGSLESLIERIARACRPEDIFGLLHGTAEERAGAIQGLFHALCREIHPDANANAPGAADAFRRLAELRDRALAATRNGSYGHGPDMTLETRQHRYVGLEAIPDVGVALGFWCLIDGATPGLLTIARSPADNDLLRAEARTLRLLGEPDRPEAAGYRSMLPRLVESLTVAEAGGIERQASVFQVLPGYVSLAGICTAYPGGVHPKDMAWIFRRLLDVLGYAHARGFIHGAVLPANVLVGTGDIHEVVLANWQASINAGDDPVAHIAYMDLEYESFYPPEVAERRPPTPGTDLLMAARCMAALLGGDPSTGRLPDSLPRRLAAFLKSCLVIAPGQRPQDAWRLRAEFTETIDLLWGRREFRPLRMPS